MSCCKSLGSVPESRQLQAAPGPTVVRQGSEVGGGGSGGRAREGSALPSNNTGARCFGARAGIPCRNQNTRRGDKREGRSCWAGTRVAKEMAALEGEG